MASVDVVSLHWTNDISMRQFIDQFTHQLPQLLRTTSGYSDVDNINDIGTDEVFVVVGIQKQKRVIAETEINHFVSIPLNSPLRFRRLTSKKSTARSEATTLDKLHADDQLEGQRVEMECDTTVFNLSSDGKCSEKLGRLTIRDTYNEKYLVARTVIEGEVSDNTVGIPVYLPITVQVAAESHKGVFRRLLGPSPSTTVNVLCEEVLVFDECPKGDYEYVNPMKYARSSMTSTSSQSSLPSGARGPQQQQVPVKTECSRSKPLHAASPHLPARGFDNKNSGSEDDDEDEDDESSNDYEKISDSDNDYEQPSHVITRMAHTLPPGFPGFGKSSSSNFSSLERVDCKPALVQRQHTEPPLRSTRTDLPPNNSPVRRPVPIPPRLPLAAPTGNSSSLSQHLQQTTRRTPRPPPNVKPKPNVAVDGTPRTSDGGAIAALSVSKVQPIPMQVVLVSPRSVGPKPCSPIRPAANPKPTFVSPACCTASSCRSPESQLPLSMEGVASPSKLEENATWQTLYDVPLNIEHFTIEELCRMLQLLRMPSLAVAFREQSVDGQLMMSIVTEESLVKDFNCSTFEAKKLIHFTKHQWRPKR